MENFDLYAKNWDTESRIIRAKAIAKEIRTLIEMDNTNKTAMDFGCGTGLVGLQMADCFDSILFVDISAAMLQQVNEKFSLLNIQNATTLCWDFTTNTPNGLHVDYIFSSLALHHIKDTEYILSCFYKLLNKRGRLIIVDLDMDDGSFHAKYNDFDGHNGFDQNKLINLSKTIGFSNVESHTFYYGNKNFNDKENCYSLFILSAEKEV